MARRLSRKRLIALAIVASASMPAPTFAAMEVRDSTNLIQNAKTAAESVEQTMKLKEILDMAQRTAAAIGPATALTQLTPGAWFSSHGNLLQCIMPNLSGLIPRLGSGSFNICGAQEELRKTLGLPTTADIDREMGQARGMTRDAVTRGKLQSIRTKRRTLADDAAFDGLATALGTKQSVSQGNTEAMAIINEAAATTTMQQKAGLEIRALAAILQELSAHRAILAQMLYVMSTDRLADQPLAYELAPTGALNEPVSSSNPFQGTNPW